MPEQPEFVEHQRILRFEEILDVVDALEPFGLKSVRLTGGEPTLRRGLAKLVGALTERTWITSLGMTTNGLHLLDVAGPLRAAGLESLNVSLDTLNDEVFERLTRRTGLRTILAGIEHAARLGFRLKLNVVPIRGVNDGEIEDLLRFGAQYDAPVRFIEFMPFGSNWGPEAVVSEPEIVDRLATLGVLESESEESGHTRRWAVTTDFGGRNALALRARFGVIPTISDPFCDRCDRMRLTADGRLLACMFESEGLDIRSILRCTQEISAGSSLEEAIGQALENKPAYLKNQLLTTLAIKPVSGLHSVGG